MAKMGYIGRVVSKRILLDCCKLRLCKKSGKGAETAHNPEVTGSNPVTASRLSHEEATIYVVASFLRQPGL